MKCRLESSLFAALAPPGATRACAAVSLAAALALPACGVAPGPVQSSQDAAAAVSASHAHDSLRPAVVVDQPDWWVAPYPEVFDGGQLPNKLSLVHVEGKLFKNAEGETVVFRGVNISDPDKLEQTGQFKRALFEEIQRWGANLIRIPVHPIAWQRRGPKAYFELLDQTIRWANELSMYVIVDWHSMGNLRTEMYQHEMYDTTLSDTMEFWRAVAHRYQGVPTVAMYELFNEPTRRNGTLGQISWQQWKEINEELISIIYAHDTDVIPLVAGFRWAYELEPVAEAPIEHENVAYVSHPYPQKTEAPFEENWEKVWGFVADRYPLVATEIGYMGPNDPGAHRPALDDGSYGPRITDYLAKKGASWTAWCFDPDWAPQLIKDWDYTPTPAGEHFRKAMQTPVNP